MNSKQVWPQAATMWSTTWLIEIQIKVTKAIACVTHYCYYYWLLLWLLIIVVVIDYCYHNYLCLVSPIILITSMFIWVEMISVFWSQVIWSKMISCLVWYKKRPSWKFKVSKRPMEGKRSLTSCQTYFTPQFTRSSIVVYTFISWKAVLQRQKFKEM